MQQNNNNNPSHLTFPPGQNGHPFADDIFICIFLNENVLILIKISLKFNPKVTVQKNESFYLLQIQKQVNW